MKILNALILVPMTLSQWTPVPIASMACPEIKVNEGVWEIKTDGNAGGYAYVLPGKLEQKDKLNWSWSVEKFPQVEGKSPLEKNGDDYALRIGVLISGDKEIKVPPSLGKMVENLGAKLSYVLFYSAANRKDWTNRCALSPFSESVINCFRSISKKSLRQTEAPLQDLANTLSLAPESLAKLRIVGLWIFADSDNSHSSSAAHLQNLEFTK